jgi:hypothetical protein
MQRWQDSRDKEARRAAQIEAERPTPKYRDGQIMEIKGKAAVDFTDEKTGERTRSDHQSALGKIESIYWSERWGCHVYALKTEDGPVRGVPEHRLRLVHG